VTQLLSPIFSRLVVTAPSDREVVLTRAFDAPRHLVFKALTTPELLKRWYGPPGWSLVECEIDLRVGGAWRFLSHGPEGEVMGSRGVYREIERPDRLVNTEAYDDSSYPGDALVTARLVELSGRTTLTTTVLYASREARDGVLSTNMEQGAGGSFNRLEALLTTLATE
jgi:uncharacterized protein YndB with AHSA1/START domain